MSTIGIIWRKNVDVIDELSTLSGVSLGLSGHVGRQNSHPEPYELDDGDDAHADAEAQQATDGGEEADPRLAWERFVLHDCGSFEVDLQDGDVVLECVVHLVLKSVGCIKWWFYFPGLNARRC